MKFTKLRSFLSAMLMVAICSVMLASCKCKIKDDQLAKIAELRRQEKSLQSEIQEKQSQKARVDAELQSRTNELNDCNKKREIVKQRLAV